MLLATSGERYRLADATLDRRGEGIVCQVGRLAAHEPGAGSATAGAGIEFEALEVSAGTPMRLREIRGGGRT